MLYHLLGWLTVLMIVVTLAVTVGALWLALYRPWAYRRRVRVPREVPELEWVAADQDNPIPWI